MGRRYLTRGVLPGWVLTGPGTTPQATGVIDISTVSRLRERPFEVADAGRPLIVDLWMTGVDRRIPLSCSLDGAVASIAASGADG
jgi:hypothetical protein